MHGPDRGGASRRRGRRKTYRLIGFTLALFLVFATAVACEEFGPQGGWSAPVADGDYLYVGNTEGRIVRINANAGVMDAGWRYPGQGADGLGAIYGSPVIASNVVYASGYTCRGNLCDGEVFAVDVNRGQPVWSEGGFQIDTKLVGSVGVGQSTVVFGTSAVNREDEPPGYLYALNPQADAGLPVAERVGARLKWRLPVDGAIWSTPAVVDDIAYFGTMGGTFYAVDLRDDPAYEADATERVLWQFEADGAITASPLAANGKIYFGDFQNMFYALDPDARAADATGSTLNPASEWSFESRAWFWAQPLLDNGVIYASTLHGRVYALNADTGAEVWAEPASIGHQIVAPPAIIESRRGQALAVPSGDQDVFVIGTASGQDFGRFVTGQPVKSSPTVVGPFLYVSAVNGDLMWFATDDLTHRGCIETRGGNRCG